jgi:hypothetical protein
LEQTNFYMHFKASPPRAGNNHRVLPVELALLPSTPAKAPVGTRCSDCAGQKRRNGWSGQWGPARSVPTAALVSSMSGSDERRVLSTSIKPRFPSHRRHQKLVCCGSSARKAGLVARGSRVPSLRH